MGNKIGWEIIYFCIKKSCYFEFLCCVFLKLKINNSFKINLIPLLSVGHLKSPFSQHRVETHQIAHVDDQREQYGNHEENDNLK